MDNIYYFLRNLVIVYSIATFFVGFYLQKYFLYFFNKTKHILGLYILMFLLVPNESFFERFGMATLFPPLFKRVQNKHIYWLLVPINFVYAVTYHSSTAAVVGMFYVLLLASPSYKFFKIVVITGLVFAASLMIYLHPYVAMMYNVPKNEVIELVMKQHPLLAKDPNNTWRILLWDQILFNHFPGNIFGAGFGTPMLTYFPVEDPTKMPSLPYVVGGHNSFIYLFGRLGIVAIVFLGLIYRKVFKEFFNNRDQYLQSDSYIFFLSFFAISIVAAFNPVLETPIFASSYWLFLGLVARSVYNRSPKKIFQKDNATFAF
ncbi:hypothetical protein [Pinibacter aurantiacus]|uniref:O-antigen ligase family protein n=1 Tax=Pinibacter aurantiacus TaxID=2851599 RepID=A0A9E2W7J2_9BACT|nr:hypothetical protein [Pinibacter aurantiacus]MBV4356372.1 hypothetical protein [Pinibacter aurantiacus]